MGNPPLELMPCAGLANKLRAIVSGMCWAQDLGTTLHVVWRSEMRLLIGQFYTYFDVQSVPSWVSIEECVTLPHSGWNTVQTICTHDEFANYVDQQMDRRPYRVKSYSRFHTTDNEHWWDLLRVLKPHPDFLVKRNQIFGPIAAPVVGVHIRRTDNKKSIQFSPSQLFWDAMEACSPDTVFYFATDDEAERAEAVRRFGADRILVGYKTILGRDTIEGGHQGMLDLYCLSTCSKILGSYWSSFSEMAAAWGNVPLETMISSPAP
jgi:hypothetical protein